VISRDRLAGQLRALGLRAGNTVMVHASVRAVGEVAGGPDEIHLAIKDVLTATGTMMMYAGCPDYVDEVGRGCHTPELEAEILEKLPPFDADRSRSCRDHGVLVEMFRTYPGTRANPHPARFVAWGEGTSDLFAHQPWHFAFGHDSALERLVFRDGRILLLGSDHDNVTFLHYAEHIVDIPGKRVARFRVPVTVNGVREWVWMEEFDTSSKGMHANWTTDFFARLVDTHLEATGNRGGWVGNAPSYLIDARALLEHASDVMRAVAADSTAAPSRPILPLPARP